MLKFWENTVWIAASAFGFSASIVMSSTTLFVLTFLYFGVMQFWTATDIKPSRWVSYDSMQSMNKARLNTHYGRMGAH